MIKLYTAPSCLGCRKVKKYFKEHNINFTEKSIMNHKLQRDEIYKMLVKSENGFEDIISTRSKVFRENNIDYNKLNLSELIDFIIKHPTVLKRPIIVADYELQVGYNDDDISIFLPPEFRDQACNNCFSEEECNYAQNIKVEE